MLAWASSVAQMVKNLPAVLETQVHFLHWEDLLEKKMATYSSVLAWRIPWTEKPGGLQSMESQRAWHDWVTNTLFIYWVIMGLKSNMTGVLLREKDRQTDTHADIYTYIHTERERRNRGGNITGKWRWRVELCCQKPKIAGYYEEARRKARDRFFLRASRRNQLCWPLDFILLDSRTMRE